MLQELYPEKLPVDLIPVRLDLETLTQLYSNLSTRQRNYPLVVLMDDLPIQLPRSLGSALEQIALTGCLAIPGLDNGRVLEALQTSINLFKPPS